ncbi:MAG: AraC family transcriptional regulator [Myxococcota bacterium]
MQLKALAHRATSILDRAQGDSFDSIAGMLVYRKRQPTEFEAMVYDPIACLILQGAKQTVVHDQTFEVATGHCFVVSHDLPVQARITDASADQPYLALIFKLDLSVLRSLYDEVGETPAEGAAAMELAPADPATLAVVARYLELGDDPVAARVLLPVVRKELHFRLYMSPSGAMLRSLLRRDSYASKIGLAISTLRRSYRQPLAMTELARSVGMSSSSFHKHFKSVTLTTPLQYQKDLRLTEARRLLRGGERGVAETAYEVGYESASQLSREYARKFGRPPMRDVAHAG